MNDSRSNAMQSRRLEYLAYRRHMRNLFGGGEAQQPPTYDDVITREVFARNIVKCIPVDLMGKASIEKAGARIARRVDLAE